MKFDISVTHLMNKMSHENRTFENLTTLEITLCRILYWLGQVNQNINTLQYAFSQISISPGRKA
jgi:hypothetical protein